MLRRGEEETMGGNEGGIVQRWTGEGGGEEWMGRSGYGEYIDCGWPDEEMCIKGRLEAIVVDVGYFRRKLSLQ
jgi:hypothetical protein